jgi:hypothetical protein
MLNPGECTIGPIDFTRLFRFTMYLPLSLNLDKLKSFLLPFFLIHFPKFGVLE